MENPKYIIDINDYDFIERIGSGSYSEVFKVKKKNTNDYYAAKLFKSEIDLNISREIDIISKSNHPAILKFIGYSPTSNVSDNLVVNPNNPLIITELSENGSLSKIIEYQREKKHFLNWDDTKKLITIFGVASGMLFLHKNNIIHRDLKPLNILMNEMLFPLIADFGLSKKTDDPQKSSTRGKGTPLYFAPELFNDNANTFESDVYAFGMTVFEIMCESRPFKGLNWYQLMTCVKDEIRPDFVDPIPSAYKNLIERCWSQNPDDRPSFISIVNELKTNPQFITKNVRKQDFLDYVQYIENYESSFDNQPIENFIHDKTSPSFQKVDLKNLNIIGSSKNSIFHKKKEKLYPVHERDKLPKDCQEQVEEAENDPEKQYLVACNLLEGKKGFPKNMEIALKYLDSSIEAGCIDSFVLKNKLMMKGRIPGTFEEAKKNVSSKFVFWNPYQSDPRILTLYGTILLKSNEHEKAYKYFEKAAKKGNPKSMYKLAVLLISGICGTKNEVEGMHYLELSKNNGYSKANLYFRIMDIMNESDKNFQRMCTLAKHIIIMQIMNFNLNKNNEDNLFELKQAIFSPYDCEFLFLNGFFEMPDFISVLKSFEFIEITVIHSSIYYNKIIDRMNQLKEILKNFYFKLNIVRNNKFEIGRNQLINEVFIDNNVLEIKDKAFMACLDLKKVNMLSVISIPEAAFESCSSLVEINIPETVSTIFPFAFNACIALKEISIPPSVKTIYQSSFKGCTSLEQITIDPYNTKVQENAFIGCDNIKHLIFDKSVKSISNIDYSVFGNISKITVPLSVTKIENKAFYNLSSLTEIELSDSLFYIEESAFESCSSLIEVKIPESVLSIGLSAFKNCSSLNKIFIPDSVDVINDFTFSKCTSLSEIAFPNSLKSIGNQAFEGCISLKEIKIPESVSKIGSSCFEGCSSISKVELSSSLTEIGNSIFKKCTSLSELIIPDSIQSIGDSCFSHCSSLNKITIPSLVTHIGSYAFFKCSSLNEIEIQSSLTSIGNCAFSYCTSLQQIVIPNSVTEIGDHAFTCCSLLSSFEIPSSVKKIENYTFSECSSLVEINISESITTICDYAFHKCSSLKQITIPSATLILESAFCECSSLEKVTILSSLEAISSFTFSKCAKLAEVVIPSTVKTIEDYAFFGCSSLTKLTDTSSIIEIKNYSFYKCSSLKEILIPSANLIGESAFNGCSSLIEIAIPNSITKIESYSFNKCIGCPKNNEHLN